MVRGEPFRGVSWKGAIDVQAEVGRCSHGSTYRKGCRCDTCRATVAQYMQNYRRRAAEKSWGVEQPTELVDSEPAVTLVKHIHLDKKIKLNEISRATGIGKDTVTALRYNRRKKITRATSDRFFEVYGDPEYLPRARSDRSLESFSKHAWKVYALLAQGWTFKLLRDQADGTAAWLDHISEKKRIQYQHVKQLDRLVEKIGDRHGPSRQNATRMKNRGYFPLIHYREDGRLILRSLLPEQREALERVQSKHGEPAGGDHGAGPRAERGRGIGASDRAA